MLTQQIGVVVEAGAFLDDWDAASFQRLVGAEGFERAPAHGAGDDNALVHQRAIIAGRKTVAAAEARSAVNVAAFHLLHGGDHRGAGGFVDVAREAPAVFAFGGGFRPQLRARETALVPERKKENIA